MKIWNKPAVIMLAIGNTEKYHAYWWCLEKTCTETKRKHLTADTEEAVLENVKSAAFTHGFSKTHDVKYSSIALLCNCVS